jgi:predicted anti-sigma-YlaC factor YlaD
MVKERGKVSNMLSCHQTVRLTFLRLERPLLPLERVSRLCHLLFCSHCRAYVRQVRGLLFAMKVEQKNAEIHLPGLPPEARSRIAAALADVDQQ